MRTISQNLLRAVVPGILLTLLASGVVLDLVIGERLEEDFDSLLIARAEALMALTEEEDGFIEVEDFDVALPGYSREEDPDYFVLLDADGAPIVASPSVGDAADWSEVPAPGYGYRFADVTLPDGRPGRMARIGFLPALDLGDDEMTGAVLLSAGSVGLYPAAFAPDGRPRRPLTLDVAVGSGAHEALVRGIRLGLLGTGLATTLAIVLLARSGIRRTLTPLEDASRQVAALDEARLDSRIDVDAPSAEIHALVTRFNALLARLHDAFERERRFSGDVAHELRTPIAEMRTLLEVSRAFPDDAALRESFVADLESSTARMQRTVEQLLALVRSEAGTVVDAEPVELAALVHAEVRERGVAGRERGLETNLSLPTDPVVAPNGELWATVVGNLVGNAFAHADEGSTIDVRLELDGADRPTLTVSNAAASLEPEDTATMFERLWRKDKSRTAADHSGLGLALARACAAQLGYDVRAELDGAHRLSVSVVPAPDDSDGRAALPRAVGADVAATNHPSTATVGKPSTAFRAGSA